MEALDIKKMKELKDKNRRLKKVFADLSLECRTFKDIIDNSFTTSDKAGTCSTICDEYSLGIQDTIAEQRQYIFISTIPCVMN